MGIFLAFLPLFIFLVLVSPPLAQSSKDAPPPPATYTHTHTKSYHSFSSLPPNRFSGYKNPIFFNPQSFTKYLRLTLIFM